MKPAAQSPEPLWLGINGEVFRYAQCAHLDGVSSSRSSGVNLDKLALVDKVSTYQARITMNNSSDVDLLMDKYDIDFVYHIKQVGVAAVADYVKLNNESADLFVYDGDLSYLDKGNDKLLFSETYYLAAKQLELEDGEDPIDGGDGYEVPAETGGENDYPANVNDNPGTGR